MPDYSKVKIVVTTGDVETTYEVPEVKNFEMDVKYDERELKKSDRQFDTMTIESLSFTMHPLKDLAGRYIVITRREGTEVVL